MESLSCSSCETTISASSVFCFNCGSRLKCFSCEALLIKNARFCSQCGTAVENRNSDIYSNKNTVNYRKTKDEVFCEVSLTNEVGKEGITELIKNLTNNRHSTFKRLENFENVENDNLDNEHTNETLDENIEKHTDLDGPVDKKGSIEKFPHINDVEMNVNCNEVEWILIYAFYESSFAAKTFTRQAVYEKYMSKRKTETRVKNFSSYWKGLFKHYISTVNDTEFKFKPNKLEHIKALIIGKEKGSIRALNKNKSGNENTKNEVEAKGEKVNSKTSTKNRSNEKSYSLIPSLNLNPVGKTSLNEFFSKFTAETNPELILIIIYYLERILEEKEISTNSIYTCIKKVSRPVPNIFQTLRNIHSRKGWINTSNFSDLKVTVAGENYIEHEISKK